jgi:hypothetical protein
MFEKVFDLARSGDGYLAIERGAVLIRKLKHLKQFRDGFFFMLQLSNVLLDSSQCIVSSVAANRAISVFPAEPVALA